MMILVFLSFEHWREKQRGKKIKKREESRYFTGLREPGEQVGSCLQGWPDAERWQRKLAQQVLMSARLEQVMKTSCCLDSHSIFSSGPGRWQRRSPLPHHHPFSPKVSGNLTSQLLNLESPKQHLMEDGGKGIRKAELLISTNSHL